MGYDATLESPTTRYQTVSLIMFIVATILFLLAGLNVASDKNLIAWGLMFLALGHWIGNYA